MISLEGAEIARQGGLRVVMDRCMKVEHARLLGRMHWLGMNTGQITGRRPLDAWQQHPHSWRHLPPVCAMA